MKLMQGIRAKNLHCQIESTKLRVTLNNDPTKLLLYGEFSDTIRPNESVWSVESAKTLSISLEKIKPTWWASA